MKTLTLLAILTLASPAFANWHPSDGMRHVEPPRPSPIRYALTFTFWSWLLAR